MTLICIWPQCHMVHPLVVYYTGKGRSVGWGGLGVWDRFLVGRSVALWAGIFLLCVYLLVVYYTGKGRLVGWGGLGVWGRLLVGLSVALWAGIFLLLCLLCVLIGPVGSQPRPRHLCEACLFLRMKDMHSLHIFSCGQISVVHSLGSVVPASGCFVTSVVLVVCGAHLSLSLGREGGGWSGGLG